MSGGSPTTPPPGGTFSGAATGSGVFRLVPPRPPPGTPQTPAGPLTASQRNTGDSGLVALGASPDRAVLELVEGDMIAGRYRVVQLLGRGGMGAVYQVNDANRSDGSLALKIMLPSLRESAKHVERFRNEYEIGLRIRSPHVCWVHEFGLDAERGAYYFTMQFIRGRTLRAILGERAAAQRPFSVEEAVGIVEHVLEGLAEAHAVSVHRDLKPENVMVVERGGIKILDFGIAKDRGSALTTVGGASGLGTTAYMAPEQRVDSSEVDARADIYSTFLILYELLTLVHRDRLGKPVREVRPEAPQRLEALIERALNTDKERRPASAKEALRLLRRSLRPVPLWQTALPAALLAVLLVLLAVQVKRGFFSGPRTRPDARPPTIALTPAPDAPVRHPRYEVSGRVSDDTLPPEGIVVLVASAPVEVHHDGTFRRTVTLRAEGRNEIVVEANDETHPPVRTVTAVILDRRPPEITLDPVPAVIDTDSVTVRGTVSEEGTFILVGGRSATVSGGRFSAVVPLPKLGRHDLDVFARDRADNEAEVHRVTVTRVAGGF